MDTLDGEVHGLLFAVDLYFDWGKTIAHGAIGSLVEWDLGIKVVCHGGGANES